ncbi:Hypp3948 [Branchiostoma lanceolatum]|uniref:Hypp3948 protein n=1 Tax=Branchiostoma lanceolatum TaxID=7740 RepID=A0A8K0A5V7_BRALA|nr:Hypp3948 [Branchiostoma lanceolatum]
MRVCPATFCTTFWHTFNPSEEVPASTSHISQLHSHKFKLKRQQPRKDVKHQFCDPANIAGYHPGKVDKFALRATRKVKKGEQYPEEVSYDTMTAARDKLRVMVVTGLTVAAVLGSVWFIKKGKAERDHGDTLSKRNLARKEQWDAEKKAADAETPAADK